MDLTHNEYQSDGKIGENAETSFSNFNSIPKHHQQTTTVTLKALDNEEADSQGDSNFEEYLDEER
jgi:hypothetical protein